MSQIDSVKLLSAKTEQLQKAAHDTDLYYIQSVLKILFYAIYMPVYLINCFTEWICYTLKQNHGAF